MLDLEEIAYCRDLIQLQVKKRIKCYIIEQFLG